MGGENNRTQHRPLFVVEKFVQIAGKSGGLLTVMCPHGICVGFKVLYLHEGPSDYV